MKELHAWLEGRLIGTFIENNGEISFRYAEGVSHPISLSLPLSGGWTRRAPEAFLDNLLPDRPSARKRMKEETGAASTDMFDLLNGADATGGVELSFGDERPSLVGATVIPVSEDDIAKVSAPFRTIRTDGGLIRSMCVFLLEGISPSLLLRSVAECGSGRRLPYPPLTFSNRNPSTRRMPRSLRMRLCDLPQW